MYNTTKYIIHNTNLNISSEDMVHLNYCTNYINKFKQKNKYNMNMLVLPPCEHQGLNLVTLARPGCSGE
jgi:hypothetical protein